jgi:hypothetical protein
MLGQRQLHRITVRLFDKIATKIVAKLYNESFASCGHTAATTLMSRNHAVDNQQQISQCNVNCGAAEWSICSKLGGRKDSCRENSKPAIGIVMDA